VSGPLKEARKLGVSFSRYCREKHLSMHQWTWIRSADRILLSHLSHAKALGRVALPLLSFTVPRCEYPDPRGPHLFDRDSRCPHNAIAQRVMSAPIGIVLVHALFVVFETALLVWMAIKLRSEIEAVGCEPAELSEVSQELANGNLAVVIKTTGTSARSLVRSMERMRTELKSNFERERSSSEENGRIRTALDCVSAGAMVADPDGKIIYMNDSANAIFRNQASEIRKQMPQFDAERILGSSLDAFRGMPSHQQTLLSNLTSTHRADVKLGGAVLRVVATRLWRRTAVRSGRWSSGSIGRRKCRRRRKCKRSS
jgi:PAS domain-containing protein